MTSRPADQLATVQTPAGRALRTPPPVCLVAVVPSATRPKRQHAIMRSMGEEGVAYGCTCEGGTFRPARMCVHVRAFLALELPVGSILTPEGYVVRDLIAASRAPGAPGGATVAPEDLAEAAEGGPVLLPRPTRIPGTRATYRARHELGRLGCSWVDADQEWEVPSHLRAEAEAAVARFV